MTKVTKIIIDFIELGDFFVPLHLDYSRTLIIIAKIETKIK